MLTVTLVYLLICLLMALRAAARDREQVPAAALLASAVLLFSAQWLFTASAQVALAGLAVFTGGVLAYRPARTLPLPALPLWTGFAVIAVSSGIKCFSLAEWPTHLNAYSAETGWWGIRTLAGEWPVDFFRGKEFDLVAGGTSPLHLPLLWVTVRLFGGTIYAVRMAEVAASTVLLVVFWLWLRRQLAGGWALLSLTVFAMSPWHLAQSRMGTFYSASVAVALSLLYLGGELWSTAGARLRHWLAFGFCTGLIGYSYAPLKVLYAFSLVVTCAVALASRRGGRRQWWRGPLLAVSVVAVAITVQLGGLGRFDEMFRRDFGPLATDTSVWHKTAADEVTAEVQPLPVVAANVMRNAVVWWDWTWADTTVLAWYAPALAVAVPAASVLLFRPPYWVPSLYFLIGALPPLIIFPVQRRSLVLWPLVYVAGVVGGRELARIGARQINRRWWRGATWSLLAACLGLASAHGLHVYATTNSIVGIRPYFGPDHQVDMMIEAERMLPLCRVYFVNPTVEERLVTSVRLFEAARQLGDRDRFGFIEFVPGEDRPDVPYDLPLCFFELNRPDEVDAVEGAVAALAELFPEAMALRRWAGDGSDTLFYTILMVRRGEEDGGESD